MSDKLQRIGGVTRRDLAFGLASLPFTEACTRPMGREIIVRGRDSIVAAAFWDSAGVVAVTEWRSIGSYFLRAVSAQGDEIHAVELEGCSGPQPFAPLRAGPSQIVLNGCGSSVEIVARAFGALPGSGAFADTLVQWVAQNGGLVGPFGGLMRNAAQNLNCIAVSSRTIAIWDDACTSFQDVRVIGDAFPPPPTDAHTPGVHPFRVEGVDDVFVLVITWDEQNSRVLRILSASGARSGPVTREGPPPSSAPPFLGWDYGRDVPTSSGLITTGTNRAEPRAIWSFDWVGPEWRGTKLVEELPAEHTLLGIDGDSWILLDTASLAIRVGVARMDGPSDTLVRISASAADQMAYFRTQIAPAARRYIHHEGNNLMLGVF